ncbi:uncharacterized protein L969DRAFT_50327 [Mixia osmundae IAM 14324]|uniref:Peptidase A1 domain-containing protein n=1 Tax=Mixia osmundae (strain CBS 9802 / IAM 14324 / JCM 22182 / KY 12970) TaxID=764103 RepID=G7E6W9_MIXOS|nr:uncharacterized protein L969DRAFT_50327 [Mixia osmundae IAM 14324]KEI39039.1 hypothetical protein L969DRAFT_50327 [Mixia osmundae IAM 14324]GAA98579.1 hypothetical protein E5Q_05266 [Mixia osmundae IAM 14324]
MLDRADINQDGDVHGTMVYDQVTLAGKTFKGCFGISELEPKFVELDRDVYGITALGVQLMQNQTLQAPTHYVPTFLQSMRDAGVIQHAIVSLNFASPPSIKSVDALAGSVTIGAIDTSKIKGAITWSNRQNVDGQAFWAIKVGFPTLGVRNAVSLIDSGTTMVALEEAAFDRYFAALKPRGKATRLLALIFLTGAGATYDDTLGVVQMPKGVVPDTLPFVLSGRTFVLTGQQQLVGSEMYGLLGLDTTKHYSWITKGSTVSVLGLHLIEKFSVIFDEEHHQIGFAERA